MSDENLRSYIVKNLTPDMQSQLRGRKGNAQGRLILIMFRLLVLEANTSFPK